MGYRLNIDKLEHGALSNIYYGSKLFGYEESSDQLSYIYLLSLGKIDVDTYFDYSANIEIPLNLREFIIFINLYNLDLNKYVKEKDYIINIPEIQKEVVGVDIINDNAIYIISWC